MEIPRLNPTTTKFIDFYFDYLMKNKPCIFTKCLTSEWKSRNDWTNSEDDAKPNFDNFKRLFNGYTKVPVINCENQANYDNISHSREMTLSEFLDTISEPPIGVDCLYLKDWHFQSQFKNYSAYVLPSFFQSDWLNEYWDFKNDSIELDYKFVYVGAKGSWTPFHADVFRSFSWSANVCGRKLWYIAEPGCESIFCTNQNSQTSDIRKSKSFNDPLPAFSSLMQEAGEIIFIPSYWRHQVHNLEDTISINHNWCNAANANLVWKYLRDSLENVRKEIIHLSSSLDDWHDQCQKILKADIGLNYLEFVQLLHFIRKKRRDKIDLSIFERIFITLSDLERHSRYKNSCLCVNFSALCPSCDEFLTMYDFEISSRLLNEIIISDQDFRKLSCYSDCCKLLLE